LYTSKAVIDLALDFLLKEANHALCGDDLDIPCDLDPDDITFELVLLPSHVNHNAVICLDNRLCKMLQVSYYVTLDQSAVSNNVLLLYRQGQGRVIYQAITNQTLGLQQLTNGISANNTLA
jgi:hypothetical protein